MKTGRINVAFGMDEIVERVLALSAAESLRPGAGAALTPDSSRLIASLGWMAVRLALGELNPWMLEAELRGEYTPEGSVSATLRYNGPSVDSTWIADAMKASMIDFAAREAMKSLAATSGNGSRRIVDHGEEAARLLREMKTTLRGIDLGRRYRLTPHWY